MGRTQLLEVIRIAVHDKSRMGTQLLCEALAREHSFEVTSVVRQSVDEIAATAPHVALVSTNTEGNPLNCCELVHQLRSKRPETKTILLIEESTRELVREAFRAGARGVFSRSESSDSLFKCIASVHRGQVWANQTQIMFLLEAVAEPIPMRLIDAKGNLLLSQREHSVVSCVAEGLSNREIAEQLKLSEHTVKNYLCRIFDKLGVSKRVELISYAIAQMQVRSEPVRSEAITAWIDQDPTFLTTCPDQLELPQFPPYTVAKLYRDGHGVPADKVTALMWFKVAEALGVEERQSIVNAYRQLKAAATPEEVAEAHRRAAEWLLRQRERSGDVTATPIRSRSTSPA